MVPEDLRSVLVAISSSEADEVYFLAGPCSVVLSFDEPAETIQPAETIKCSMIGTLNVLEACRMSGKVIFQYFSGSSECFGDTDGLPATETTPFRPGSPYGVGKASTHWLVDNYREAYGLFACTGILFSHEFPLRPSRFVTQKIVQAAKRIADGSRETLELGRLDIVRDWGWAPEYVEAIWRMLQQDEPSNYVIATGVSCSLEEFVQIAFSNLDLDWKDHVRQVPGLFRPTEISVSSAYPSKAKELLGWVAHRDLKSVVSGMVSDDLGSDLRT